MSLTRSLSYSASALVAAAAFAFASPASACSACGCSAGAATEAHDHVHKAGEGHGADAAAAGAKKTACATCAAGEHCAACAAKKSGKTASAEIGQPAPDFTLMDQNGEPVSLSDHLGSIVVLEFFNDQCPFVKKFYENGDMNRMAAEAADAHGAVWLAIDSSHFSSVEENQSIAEEWSIDRPLLDGADGSVGQLYGAKTTPHMFVIDAEGQLAYAGAIDSKPSVQSSDIADADNHVMAAVAALAAGEPVETAETKPYGCSVKYGDSKK